MPNKTIEDFVNLLEERITSINTSNGKLRFSYGPEWNVSVTGSQNYPYVYLFKPIPATLTTSDLKFQTYQVNLKIFQIVSQEDNPSEILQAQGYCETLFDQIVAVLNDTDSDKQVMKVIIEGGNKADIDPESEDATNDRCAGMSFDFQIIYYRCY